MLKWVVGILAVVFIGVVVRLCTFTVDRSEFVYLTQFGRHVETYDGGDDEQAGLHFKLPWPIQTVTRVEKKLQYLDLPSAELITADPVQADSIDRTISVDAYVCWRIPDSQAVEYYIKRVGTTERAREALRDRVRSALGAEIARMKLDDLISISNNPNQSNKAWQTLRERLMETCGRKGTGAGGLDDGIEIVDIRLRRLNYPSQVREAIYDRIISERNKKAEQARAEGRRKAEEIRIKTDSDIAKLRTQVEAENSELRGAADAKADRIRILAFLRDPEYYAELQSQKIGLDSFDSKTKVHSVDLWDFYFPRPSNMSYPKKKPATGGNEK